MSVNCSTVGIDFFFFAFVPLSAFLIRWRPLFFLFLVPAIVIVNENSVFLLCLAIVVDWHIAVHYPRDPELLLPDIFRGKV